MGDFVHLHLHSEYSLLDGACRLADLPARVRECGHDAVALTDHGVLYGAPAFDAACRAAGIRPILGCEVYVAPGSRFDRTGRDGAYTHLVLLCENPEGYRHLVTLVSLGFTEGFYGRPRVDLELLRQYSGGLIALSGCLSGDIPRRLSAGDLGGAEASARTFAEIFGRDRFYIELQDHLLPEERRILPALARLARKLDLPLVATNDCHYLRRRDADVQEVLTCIQTNRRIGEGGRVGFATDEFYYKDTEEMRALFSAFPDALENTVRIAARCDAPLAVGGLRLPAFPCPDGLSARDYLGRLAEEGFRRRVGNGDVAFQEDGGARSEQAYRDRLAYELSVIARMGYDNYFLIVQDYVNFAKRQGIPVGPGRGSGAGSLVAYCLGITEVDSLAYGLLFERFLNPERVSMPDIDVDFCYVRRDEVIRYVSERYGRDCVSQIITFGTLAARAAVRDAGRVMGMSYSDVDAVACAIPQTPGITIAEALRLPALRAMYDGSAEVRRLLDTASAIEGMPRNASVHAAGVVIADRPISEFVPLAVSNGAVITQYDMDTIARLGILKFDFLGLRYLTIMRDAELQARESDPSFSLDRVPMDDPETYDLLGRGQTLGVFQLESPGMRQLLANLRPRSIEDIEIAIALYRPGPMEAIPAYIERRRDPSKIRYPSPLLEPVLAPTCGVTVFQEQVMDICRALAGYTLGHADIVRRAMSKKKAAVLEAERGSFVSGAVRNGMSREDADRLFDDLGAFANYAFNKSHAAAYALISYRTAYLKARHAPAYYAALLTSVLGNQRKMGEYIAEAAKAGIAVLPPDINESRMNFRAVEDGAGVRIRYGLLALKSVGASFLDAIFRERDRGGPYASFLDFLNRLPWQVLSNRRQVETLIKAGAFDRFPAHRAQLLAVCGSLIDAKTARSRDNLEGQMDMFSLSSAEAPPDPPYPDVPPLTARERLMQEREVSGMFLSGQLLDEFSRCVASLSPAPISSLLPAEGTDAEGTDGEPAEPSAPPGARVRIAGIVTSVTVRTTKKDEPMAFFTLEDSGGSIECLAFPKILSQYLPLIRTDEALFAEGTLSAREDEVPKVLVSLLGRLVDNARFAPSSPEGGAPDRRRSRVRYNPYERLPSGMTAPTAPAAPPTAPAAPTKLYLRVPDTACEAYRKAENLAEIFCDGPVSVIFYDQSARAYLPSRRRMSWTPFIRSRMEALLGAENVAPR